MVEISVAALFAAFFCATTAVAAWYVFKLVRGRASAEAEHYSKLIEIQDAHQTTREALIVKEAEVEALVRENQGIVARLQDVETEIKAERASNSLLQQELATFGDEHALQRRFERKEFLGLCAIYRLASVPRTPVSAYVL